MECLRMVFGTGYLCPAMSIAVKTMRKGEVAELAVRLFCKFKSLFISNETFMYCHNSNIRT